MAKSASLFPEPMFSCGFSSRKSHRRQSPHGHGDEDFALTGPLLMKERPFMYGERKQMKVCLDSNGHKRNDVCTGVNVNDCSDFFEAG
jgi:hypothetical protein